MVRLLRMARLARLAKVLKVLRSSRIVARYDDRVGLSFVKLRIAKYMLLILISTHWVACFLRLVPLIEDSETSWIRR